MNGPESDIKAEGNIDNIIKGSVVGDIAIEVHALQLLSVAQK